VGNQASSMRSIAAAMSMASELKAQKSPSEAAHGCNPLVAQTAPPRVTVLARTAEEAAHG
jgi:hypothetical protein